MSTHRRAGPGHRDADTKRDVVWLLKNSVYTTALAVPAATATKPATDVATGRGVMDCEDFKVARVFIGGSDAADETINYQVILWREIAAFPAEPGRKSWVPQIVLRGVVTLGALAMPTWVVAANGLFGDAIDGATIDKGGNTLVSPSNDMLAHVEVPLKGAYLIEVQCERGTAATADAFVQLGE